MVTNTDAIKALIIFEDALPPIGPSPLHQRIGAMQLALEHYQAEQRARELGFKTARTSETLPAAGSQAAG